MASTLILPAAGLATRIGGIPKFLLPNRQGRPLIIDHIAAASGVDRVVVVTRPDLTEFVRALIHQHLGAKVDVLSASTSTMSATVHSALAALPEIEGFAVGLPDTAVLPAVPYEALYRALEDSDIAIAAYPTRVDQAGRLGALRLADHRCTEVRDKDPSASDWPNHWGALAFTGAAFRAYSNPGDAHVGFALQKGVANGANAQVVHFGEEYYDLGTVEELTRYFGSHSVRDH